MSGGNGRKDGVTEKQKSPCVLQDFVPFGAAAQKTDGWADGRTYRSVGNAKQVT